MERCFLMILISVPGFLSDSIEPKDKETNINRNEEERVTLSCSYDASSTYVHLFWYRQYPNREPEFLLYKGAQSWSSYKNIPDPQRFQSTTSQTSTELIITSATLSDSALYYCALRVAQ
ncbi:hypothetical protein R3I93_007375 [Phoxinus phoxinus]|uniref:Ig-like domain-containing protein n=1 Tax=Phoxinus phoxinus TaxID=58324 RepID=A0AAN9D657_9TELE